jgi:hypothetical protein
MSTLRIWAINLRAMGPVQTAIDLGMIGTRFKCEQA